MTEQENEQWRKRTLKVRTYPVWTRRGQEFLEDTVCEV